jgi:hypothetical protein
MGFERKLSRQSRRPGSTSKRMKTPQLAVADDAARERLGPDIDLSLRARLVDRRHIATRRDSWSTIHR